MCLTCFAGIGRGYCCCCFQDWLSGRAAGVAVELPDDATMRRELLEREARFLGAAETAPDVGQLYLSLVFD